MSVTIGKGGKKKNYKVTLVVVTTVSRWFSGSQFALIEVGQHVDFARKSRFLLI